MKSKYFNLYERSYKFNDLSETEQKTFLIERKVYIKGKEIEMYDDLLASHDHNNGNNIKFIGKDFKIDKTNYTLNPDFIDEIYNKLMFVFNNNNIRNIDKSQNVNKVAYQSINNEEDKKTFINDLNKKSNAEFMQKLNDAIFLDFHIESKRGDDYVENVFKKHLKYDIKHLSDYVFGLDNTTSFLTFHSYYSFYRISKIADFCSENTEDGLSEIEYIDIKKHSVPQSIAMLKAAGFFELENISKLTSSKLHQVIAIIIGLNPNNLTHIRSIRGNVNVLHNKSEENPLKFTSSIHVDDMLKILK